MNKLLLIFLMLAAVKLPAQTNAPVRLAVISETGEAMTAADVLTAELSNNGKIQLLERNQIEKVYRELGLSAANRDDLKLGRLLGADGLLVLNVVRTPATTNLMARLIAVKPGVVLTDGSFPWPLKNTPQWAETTATYLKAFLPKLTVLAKDAIPISIVNLRAAVSSAGEKETERELKLLTIQRLSQEQRLFVLERQKMQLLSNEKELKSDESPFWDGSYLLDGVVDQNGYSKDTVTINARLTPPKGGAPLSFKVSGSRTNLSQVVNRLAAKVTELLNVHSTVGEWSAAKEAKQYFQEAKWALKWGVYPEAQAAAESAWALGKRDLECNLVRVAAYVDEVSSKTVPFEIGSMTYDPGTEYLEKSDMKKVSSTHVATVFKRLGDTIQYATLSQLPDPHNINHAIYALNLYYQFSRNSSKDLLKVASATSNWKNSAWYNLGIQDLIAASKVLRAFNFAPKAQKPVADELANLRALARSVAQWISQTPAVDESYFVGNRLATHDELDNTMMENPNIFRCEVNWGCYWQENPEEEIALYRQLMSSPVFCYIHGDFWIRKLMQPRLVAWNEADQKAIPAIWESFFRQLSASTNVLLRLEAKALKFADAQTGPQMAFAFTNLFNCILDHKATLINNNVEVLYLDWSLGDLVDTTTSQDGIDSKAGDALDQLYWSKYRSELGALDQEYWNKTVPALKFLPTFQKQMRYLKDNTPYEFFKFVNLFMFHGSTYSQSQAHEILPLIISYKSNLVARSKHASSMQKGKLMGAITEVGFLENNVKRSLHPPASKPKVAASQRENPPAVKQARTAPTIPETLEAIPTNILQVNDYLKIPYNRLQEGKNNIYGFQIFAHRWNGGKLLVGLQYTEEVYGFDKQGNWKSTSYKSRLAIAIFDPGTGGWDMIHCPDISDIALIGLRNSFMPRPDNHMALFHGSLYFNDGVSLQKYNFQKHTWQNLDIPIQNGCDLFVVAGHLFATDANSILEITDDGQGMRILASTRRRPVQSTLDSLDNLGLASVFAGGKPSPPVLFSGPGHSICACIGTKIFSWNGNDWHELFDLNFSQPPEVFGTAVIFRSVPFFGSDGPGNLWIWSENQSQPQLALHDDAKPRPGIIREPQPEFFNPLHKSSVHTVHPLWKSPIGDRLTDSAATFYQSNLYCFVDHCIVTNIAGHWTVAEKNGYHAQLICLRRDFPQPIIVPLKFDLDRGQPPCKSLAEKLEQITSETSPSWIHFAGDALYIGGPNTPGIWRIPVSEIEPAIGAQRRCLLAQKAQAIAAKKRAQVALFGKYDLNHDGVLEPNEKEEAIGDTAFLESQLGVIDANHNGRLDAGELAYFDANHNGILEPREIAAINITLRLLADKIINQYDDNKDGFLEREELLFTGSNRNSPGFHFPVDWRRLDENQDQKLSRDEIRDYLEDELNQELDSKVSQADVMTVLEKEPTFNAQSVFKIKVELFWKAQKAAPHPSPARN